MDGPIIEEVDSEEEFPASQNIPAVQEADESETEFASSSQRRQSPFSGFSRDPFPALSPFGRDPFFDSFFGSGFGSFPRFPTENFSMPTSSGGGGGGGAYTVYSSSSSSGPGGVTVTETTTRDASGREVKTVTRGIGGKTHVSKAVYDSTGEVIDLEENVEGMDEGDLDQFEKAWSRIKPKDVDVPSSLPAIGAAVEGPQIEEVSSDYLLSEQEQKPILQPITESQSEHREQKSRRIESPNHKTTKKRKRHQNAHHGIFSTQ